MLLMANSIDVSKVPEEIKILPLGNVESQKGRFLVDEESTRLIIDGFKRRNLDLVIDYEHQTLDGTLAPAAGWIHELYKSDDSIMAKVEWTDRAKSFLSNKEYRYLSPVVMLRNPNLHAVALHSVALTNTPAIDGMFPLVNSLQPSDSDAPADDDLWMELCQLLGLEEGDGVDKAIERIKELQRASETSKEALEGLRNDFHMRDVDRAVEEALSTGKISPAMRDQAMRLAHSDLQAFKGFVSSAPCVVPLGRLDLRDAPRTAINGRSHINDLLGLNDDDIQRFGLA